MFAHLLDYIVGASAWGGCVEAHMRQHPWGRDAVKGHAPASIRHRVAMTFRRVEPGCLGIDDDLTHKIIP
jgi:hypothetical protein